MVNVPLAILLDEDVGSGLASDERADGDAFLSLSCCDNLKIRWRISLGWTEIAACVRGTAVVDADTAVVAAVPVAVAAGCCCWSR